MRFFILLFLCLTAGHAGFTQLKRKVNTTAPQPAPSSAKKKTAAVKRTSEKEAPACRVNLIWQGENTVILRIDRQEFALSPNGQTSASLPFGIGLNVSVKTPAKTFYPEEFLLLESDGGEVEVNLKGEKVVFEYESTHARLQREAEEKAEAERNLKEQQRREEEKKACLLCKGTGQKAGQVECGYCYGEGVYKCWKCDGTGKCGYCKDYGDGNACPKCFSRTRASAYCDKCRNEKYMGKVDCFCDDGKTKGMVNCYH
jgi:hypothetical protein